MRHELATAISAAVTELFGVTTPVELSRTDEQFGDFATNVALQLSKQLGQNPRAIAESLQPKLQEALAAVASDVTIAGRGFLTFACVMTVSDRWQMSHQ